MRLRRGIRSRCVLELHRYEREEERRGRDSVGGEVAEGSEKHQRDTLENSVLRRVPLCVYLASSFNAFAPKNQAE